MRVSDSNRTGQLQAYQKQSVKRGAFDNSGEVSRRLDEVSISPQAKELSVQSTGIEEVTNPDRLKSIKEAVTSGEYQVDSQAVAAKILARIYGEG